MKAKVPFLFLALVGLLPPMGQTQVNYAVSGNTAYIAYSPNASGNIVIASNYDGYPVTSIGESAFGWPANSQLTGVVIPNSVTDIGDFAFYGCGLTSVVIPNSVTNIGRQVFYDCTNLANVTLGTNVVSIGHDAFVYCNLTSITIPDSVTTLGDGVFISCNLTNITFLGNAPVIVGANWEFSGNPATTIYYYYGTSGWGQRFADLPATELGIPFTYTSYFNTIDITCYAGTNSVLTISPVINGYPVKGIGAYAFYNCTNLTSITICTNLTSIGPYAFDGCSGLASIAIPDNVTNIGNLAFAYCRSLTNVIVGNSVTSIGLSTFAFCTNLATIVIPNNVMSIGEMAFWGCGSLTKVVIGSGVTNIDDDAFWNLGTTKSGVTFTFLGNAPVLGDSVFVNDLATVYYYYGTSGWYATYGGLPTVELAWTPQLVGGAKIQSNNFGFTIIGTNKMPFIVEASTNLVDWQPVWTNTLSGASATFSDSQWTNYPARYYRAR